MSVAHETYVAGVIHRVEDYLGSWTGESLAKAVHRKYGVTISARTASRHLRCNTEATFECRSFATARASRRKRTRADSSPRYRSLMTFSVTGQCRSTSNAL